MSVSMSFGDKVLRNTTISGKKPKPVCMSLPGGISKFCGRVYGISRDGDQFKACLGLELRAFDDVEAALRVSCFRFGPQGMKVDPSQPLPASETLQGEDEDDEEDDEDDEDEDDDYGLDGSDDEEEDDDNAADEDAENDVESAGDSDYTGLSALSTDFLDSLFGGGGGGGDGDDDAAAEVSSSKPTAKPVKSKATTPQPQVPEKQLTQSAESVTSTSYTVSVVQDPTAVATSSEVLFAEARPTANAPLDDSPTDRVETVPTSATVSDKDKKKKKKTNKDKDYEDDEDDDDEDDDDDDNSASNEEEEEESGDIVSDIIASAASAVGITDADNSTTVAAVTAKQVIAAAEAETTTEDGDAAAKDYDDDDDEEDEEEGYRNFKSNVIPATSVMPAAIVPNDRRGRTHRRMRLSSSNDGDESTIQYMKKV